MVSITLLLTVKQCHEIGPGSIAMGVGGVADGSTNSATKWSVTSFIVPMLLIRIAKNYWGQFHQAGEHINLLSTEHFCLANLDHKLDFLVVCI